MKIIIAIFSLLTFVGCLKTREAVREAEQQKVVQEQVVTLQKSTANQETRFSDINEDIRNLSGRIEVVENKFNTSSGDSLEQARKNEELAQRVTILQEALTKLEAQVLALQAEAGAAKTAAAKSGSGKSDKKLSTFDLAENQFNDKNWKEAILSYQKYRDDNPKGKNFAEATYKTGVCFQELGMKDEARAFYEEVIAKSPNTAVAKRAKSRLSRLR